MMCAHCSMRATWTTDRDVALCEEHANAWLLGERMLVRRARKPSPGTVKAIAKRYGRKRAA